MTLRRLKWLTLVAPLAYLAAVEVAQHALLPALLHAWPGYLLIAGVSLVATLFFNEAIFGVVDRLQARQAQQNHELLALHEAGLDIIEELDLATVLQRVVDRAAELVGARYGALSLLAPDGGVEAFITTGLTPEERTRLGPPPAGHGLLGVVLAEGRRLRLADLTRDPRSVGFPPEHPAMRSLLAIPIASRGRVLGALYLTEKLDAPEFGADDEETLARFATQAAVAIQNARLHRLAREAAIGEERARIAREMHDSLAQVLGYVNTKGQAARELVRAGQDERAAAQLDQLIAAARDAYTDVREQILALRATPAPDQDFLDVLRQYLDRWQEQSGVAVALDLPPADEALRALPPTAELQLLRIIQEALSNVRKHAGASAVAVRLGAADGDVRASVMDNGGGFDPGALGRAAFPRFGLAGMRERAEAVGGELIVDSAPGRGTRVEVRIPLRTPAGGAAAPVAAGGGDEHARLDR
ncbi:MAG TPA: GAF domain-containing sensor histidine kinase [Thermomicrobiales bacterium]|nr:GAF domain-containing sensor histidine kinase [Thermomicrobiales bacterium]